MKKFTKVLAAMMLMTATLFVAGCTEENEAETSGDWVDLGLPSGLLWATRNVGATSPEDYGDYFAWGETQPKSDYSWTTYQHCNNGNNHQLTKYCSFSSYGYNGFTDNLTTLQPDDDAATANWGGSARTPTKSEWEELSAHTTAHWTTRNGVNGCILTGTNGNSIFLPAAGSSFDSGDVTYWSSSLYTGDDIIAWYCYFRSYSSCLRFGDNGSRCIGLPVRAVRFAR